MLSKITNEIEKSSDRTVDPLMVKGIILYFGSIAMSRYNFRSPDGSRIKFYLMVLGQSGLGKSFMIKLIEDYFEKAFTDYNEFMVESFEKYNELELQDKKSNLHVSKRRLPLDLTIAPEGSPEGLYSVVEAISKCNALSVAILGDEFLDNITEYKAMVQKLKECYDESFKGKVIKGTKDDSQQGAISNFTTNVLVMGSKSAVDIKTMETLIKLSSTGFFRRTIVIDSQVDVDLKNVEYVKLECKDKLNSWIKKVNTVFDEEFYSSDTPVDITMRVGESYEDELFFAKKDLFSFANKNKMIDGYQYDKGADAQIRSIASIIAFINCSVEVTGEHVKEAYQYFRDTRATAINTFQKPMPQLEIYELLKRASGSNEELSALQIKTMAMSITPSMANKRFEEIMADVRMLCYKDNKILTVTESANMGTLYSTESLPTVDLTKLIFGLSYGPYVEPRNAMEIAFEDLLLDWKNIEALCLSKNKDSFTTCWFQPTDKTMEMEIIDEESGEVQYDVYGHRKNEFSLPRKNVVAFDIDNGFSIDSMKSLLNEYTYFLYTTKSHRTEKANGEDRYRVIMPLSREIEVTSEQYKMFLVSIENFLGIKNNDRATRNSSRLWYTNPYAEYTYKNDGELLDPTPHIPNTKKFLELVGSFKELKDIKSGQVTLPDEEKQLRLDGFERRLVSVIQIGNLKDEFFKFVKFASELGITESDVTRALSNVATAKGIPFRFVEEAVKRFNQL